MNKRLYLIASLVAPVEVLILGSCAGSGVGALEGFIGCRDTGRGCPDLVADQSRISQVHFETLTFQTGDCAIVEGYVPRPGTYRLMRFPTAFPNMGPGDLIVGSPNDPANKGLFEYSPCHKHYHFRSFSTYRLWTPDGYKSWRALRDSTPENVLCSRLLASHPDLQKEMVGGSKRAFCLVDWDRYNGYSGPPREKQFTDCMNSQGITVGWSDLYDWDVEGNWIDVTGLPSGEYMLEIEVNPEHVIQEGNYSDNAAALPVTV